MTYFGFLLRFLCIPIVVLSVVAFLDSRRGRRIPDRLRAFPFAAAVAVHVVIALLYTLSNLFIDITYTWLNPRIRLA